MKIVEHLEDERGPYFVVVCDDGKTFQIDPCDFEILADYRWFVFASRGYENCQYVGRSEWANSKSRLILLHREIMQAPKGITVDHCDWNGLNNRRYNLRLATVGQNHRHVRPDSPRSGQTAASGLRGVYRNSSGKWYSIISIDGKARHLGTFGDDAEAATRAWDAAALAARGEFAVLNFPPRRAP